SDVENAAIAGRLFTIDRGDRSVGEADRRDHDLLLLRAGKGDTTADACRDEAIAPAVVPPRVLLAHRVEHLAHHAGVAHPAAKPRLAEDLDVVRIGRVDAPHD